MPVSAVPSWGLAEVSSVSISPCFCVLCAKKFAQRAQNTPNSAYLCLLGEFFRGWAAGGTLPGELFRGLSGGRGRSGRVFSRQPTLRRSWMQRGARGWLRWGFCTIRSRLAAYRRRVVLLMVQFPLFGDGEAATHSGVAPKLSTTSAKSGDNGLSWARWSTFWAQRCLAWRVVRTRTPEHAR